MPLSFPNVAILGYSQNSRAFEAGLVYSNLVKITVEGLVTDLSADFGITGVWTGAQGILPTIAANRDYQDLILNGRSFGSGRIESIQFKGGIDVRTKEYTAQLTVYDSGDLYNLGGTYYSGINSGGFQFLEGFSEDYSFDRKVNGGYAYNHSANIRFNSGVGSLDATSAAKTLAKTLFTGANLGFLFYSGYTNKQGKRFYTESYDSISNQCDFTETFDFDSDSGSYSVTRTNSFELAENGNVTAVENGVIKGITYPTFRAATAAIATEMASAYARCNEVFGLYAPSGSAALLTSPIVQTRSLDIFGNSVAYSLTFDNNPRNSGGYFLDYTQTVQRDQGIVRVIENGTVLGKDSNRSNAYLAAKAGLATTVAGMAGRISTLYNGLVGNSTNHLEYKDEQFSPYRSSCGYTYQFSNETVIVGTDGVKQIKITQNDAYPLYGYNKVNVVNVGEIAQNDYQVRLAKRNVSMELLGEKIVPLSTYLANAQTQFNTLVPTGQNPVIESAQYAFAPNSNAVTASITWSYAQIKTAGDISL